MKPITDSFILSGIFGNTNIFPDDIPSNQAEDGAQPSTESKSDSGEPEDLPSNTSGDEFSTSDFLSSDSDSGVSGSISLTNSSNSTSSGTSSNSTPSGTSSNSTSSGIDIASPSGTSSSNQTGTEWTNRSSSLEADDREDLSPGNPGVVPAGAGEEDTNPTFTESLSEFIPLNNTYPLEKNMTLGKSCKLFR